MFLSGFAVRKPQRCTAPVRRESWREHPRTLAKVPKTPIPTSFPGADMGNRPHGPGSRLALVPPDTENRSRIIRAPSRTNFRDPASAPCLVTGTPASGLRFPVSARIARTPGSARGSAILVRIRGIEPRSPPWQGGVLPLNHIRVRVARKQHDADYTGCRRVSNAITRSSAALPSPSLPCWRIRRRAYSYRHPSARRVAL